MFVMPASVSEKRAAFRALHQSGCFTLPNPWDAGSARYLQSLGFKALASTSAGFAWSIGKADNRVTREDVLEHLTALCQATDLPVNADFEGGFAREPEGVAASVRLAVETGVAGLSIEDRTGNADAPLYDAGLAVERIAAAREAIDANDSGVVLVARCEGFLVGRADLDLVVKRMAAFAEAGADCLYAPGLATPEQVTALVQAVAPKPVNVLLGFGALGVNDLAALGVRRVSVGGALARAAWGGFARAARELAEKGTLTIPEGSITGREINALMD
jgi:2-methylisocitrate lyase-like PEP mutase family enzyme